MNFCDLLRSKGFDPEEVLVLRHRPWEPQFNKVFCWLAAERPDLFNAYQQTQGEHVERAMLKSRFVAAFIGHEPGKAIFVGLYAIRGSKTITHKQYWKMPAHLELQGLGMNGFTDQSARSSILWFDLKLTDFYADWKGKLVVAWSPPERSWWRRAHRNDFPVLMVTEDNWLDAEMPEWDELVLSWKELAVLPHRWKAALSQWRGVYYIFDTFDRKGYVGSAYGETNLLGRWLNYAARGHGGNQLLKRRNPSAFRFSILQRVSPDMEPVDVIRLENLWKQRLHSRSPSGLNDN